ncbi:hypothetical protein EIP91_011997 [Steccherinum ochraceum]|uniref:Uncharacterized protein n=1 Tax=Steccherinum ochraceum TaxID=92696 RepID=A0A4R0RNV8_9APHY|nr:hypothetical protein EIP91_011997 [Steccherinum ochraceum]
MRKPNHKNHASTLQLDIYYNHEDAVKIGARFVSHLFFACPDALPVSSVHSSALTPPLAAFCTYALHRMRLHASVTFAAMYLLPRLQARFPAARASSGHQLFISMFMHASNHRGKPKTGFAQRDPVELELRAMCRTEKEAAEFVVVWNRRSRVSEAKERENETRETRKGVAVTLREPLDRVRDDALPPPHVRGKSTGAWSLGSLLVHPTTTPMAISLVLDNVHPGVTAHRLRQPPVLVWRPPIRSDPSSPSPPPSLSSNLSHRAITQHPQESVVGACTPTRPGSKDGERMEMDRSEVYLILHVGQPEHSGDTNKLSLIVEKGMFAWQEINQTEREMCSCLEGRLNVNPVHLADFKVKVRRGFKGRDAYHSTSTSPALTVSPPTPPGHEDLTAKIATPPNSLTSSSMDSHHVQRVIAQMAQQNHPTQCRRSDNSISERVRQPKLAADLYAYAAPCH